MDVHVRPAMPAPWDTSNSPQRPDGELTHDEEEYRNVKYRIPNAVKSKPANPAVISSIIDSFDTLPPPSPFSNEGPSSDKGSRRRSQRYSSEITAISSGSVQRPVLSPGVSGEYGSGFLDEESDSDNDAAMPPVVPTGRAPSGLVHHVAPNSPTFAYTIPGGNGEAYPGAPSSRRSSVSSAGIPDIPRNKLSAESWVKKSQVGEERAEAARGRPVRKSLRRKNSQEMLRPQPTPPREHSVDMVPVPLAEQIIARTPPPAPTPRGRLYLRDSTIVENRSMPSPSPPVSSADPQDNALETEKKSSPDDKATSKRVSTLRSPSSISDSIPTRTSSLRQASSSPVSRKRKEKKSKRPGAVTNKSDSGTSKRSKAIPESSWADLGEDDETVKRILELREQRKSRLQEFSAFTSPIESYPQSNLAHETPSASKSAADGQGVDLVSRPEPTANESAIHSSQLRKPVGVHSGDVPRSKMNGTYTNATGPSANTVDVSPRPIGLLDAKTPFSAHNRPSTAKSDNVVTPSSLSLDYSYADAVDVLQGVDRELKARQEGKHHRDQSKRNSLWLKGVDGQSPMVPLPHGRPVSRKSKKHPDGGFDSDRKQGRRRSVGDARNTRIFDEEELARKRSIEDAVYNFLHAERLSRRIRNPNTGRLVAFSEVGDPDGAAVFVCVGMGLTRYVTAFYDELASTLRLRLITLDRPGVGGSEPCPSSDKSGPLGWPNDVLAICAELGITKFSLLAHSAGAVYALATALILPQMVIGKVHLLAPWIPPSQLEAISHPTASAAPPGALPRGQRFLRVLPAPLFKAANSSFISASSASLKPVAKRKSSGPSPRKGPDAGDSPARPKERPVSLDARPDFNRRESLMLMDRYMPATNPTENFPISVKDDQIEGVAGHTARGSLILSATATPTDPGFEFAATALNAAEHAERERQLAYTSRLTELTWELATRDSNPATDLLVCFERHRDVGFRYTDVTREVVITHGAEDKRVPIANVKWLADQMNRHAAPEARPVEDGVGDESRDGSLETAPVRGGCIVRVLPGEGHGLMANPVIMGDVLTEIAEYWAERSRMGLL